MTGHTHRGLCTAAALVAMFLVAMDTNIVATAMPTIIGLLGGIALYSWVFSIYLLTTTITVPIYGKMADLFGRKRTFMFAAGTFLLGSVLCAWAQSMEQLILFRAVQGLGGGGVLTVTLTIISDLYTLQERAKMVAVFSAIWGLASVLGPALGGFLTDFVSWRWTFLINVPLGALAMGGLWLTLRESIEHRQRRIDYAGIVTLGIGVGGAMLVLLESDRSFRGQPLLVTALGVVSAAAVVAFIWVETRAEEPILPMHIFKDRTVAASSILATVLGVLVFGTTAFVPPFIQGIQGGTAMTAAIAGVILSVGWSIASTLGGRVLLRLGFRVTGIAGSIGLAAGALVLARLTAADGLMPMWIAMVILGLGLGMTSITTLLSVQHAVPATMRGVATSSNQFFRTIGGAIGLSGIGAIFNMRLADGLAELPGAPSVDQANALLIGEGRRAFDPAQLLELQQPLEHALSGVYTASLGIACIALIAAAFLPGGRPRSEPPRESEPTTAAADVSNRSQTDGDPR